MPSVFPISKDFNKLDKLAKVSDDFCPAPAIENTSQVITITVFPPCDNLKSNYITTNSSCSVNDGSISINPSGGFAPYVDYYSDLNGVSGTSFSGVDFSFSG